MDPKDTSEHIDFNFMSSSSMQVKAERICCSTKNDNKKRVKPRFSEVASSCKATTVRPTSAAAPGTATYINHTKNEQTENTFYAFYYYHITAEDIKCSCYVCVDLAAFKPKKQNDVASAIGFAVTTKKQSRRRAYA